MPLTGSLDQLATLFRVVAQGCEFLRALLSPSARKSACPREGALKRPAKYVERRTRYVVHWWGVIGRKRFRERGSSCCGRRAAVDGWEGRVVCRTHLPLLTWERGRKRPLRQGGAAFGRKDGKRQRRDQAAEGHGWVS